MTDFSAAGATGRLGFAYRVGREVITASLTGVITQVDIDVIHQINEEVKLAQKHKDECLAKMEELCNRWFPEQMKNL